MACRLINNSTIKVFRDSNGKFISNPAFRYGWDIVWFAKIQSNGIGRAAIRPGIDDDYSAIAGKVFQFGYNLQTVRPATNPLDHVNENPGEMGLWLEFAKAYLPRLYGERKLLIVPCAQGGTSYAGNNWNPGNSLDNNAKARVTSALALPDGINRVIGIISMLGESDADAGASAASLFQSRHQAGYNDYVANVPGITASTPFLMGTIKPDKPNAATINSALLNLSALNPAMRFVDLRDLSWFDANHYDAPSLAIAGQRFARALL